ncbi:MAG: hypothetical protein AB1796_08500 [Bacillota bacterium]
MSCSSLKQQFEQLKDRGQLKFGRAAHLYTDLQGSLDAHKLELQELQKNGDRDTIERLQKHIKDGEELLAQINSMTVH